MEVTRSRLPVLRLALFLMTFFAAGAMASAASANVPFQTINASHPVRTVYLGNELSCQFQLSVDSVFDFYPPDTAPGDCGTFVSIGSTVYGPDFNAHDGTAANSVNPVTPVSQSGVSGSGNAGDPFKITTVANAGPLRVTETTTYVDGTDSVGTTTQVTNASGGAVNDVHVYRAGDCYLAGSDVGFGAIDSSGGVYCTVSPDNNPAGRLIGFIPVTGGSHYFESFYSTVWDAIDGTDFPDTAETTVEQDNGAGLSWAVASIGSGASSTFVSNTKFFAPDPFGGNTGVSLNSSGAPLQMCGDLSCVLVQVTCNLPAGSPIPCDPFLAVSANLQGGGNAKATKGASGRATTSVPIANGQASVPPGETAETSLATTPEGIAALKAQQKKAAKAKKKAKKLKKKAKKLKAAAKKAHGKKAKKLAKKAKKLKKKAKKQKKLSKKLLHPSGQVTVTNDRTGATETVAVKLTIP